MPFITIKRPPVKVQITFEDLWSGKYMYGLPTTASNHDTTTITKFYQNIPADVLARYDFHAMLAKLHDFNVKHADLMKVRREELYHTYYIPKASGGKRRIDDPYSELRVAHDDLKKIFAEDFFVLYHTAAYAYIEKRSNSVMMEKHQQNESKWFLHADLTDFFGSTSLDFLERMLALLFPFSEVVKLPGGKEELHNALDLCMFRGGLPQGSTISPMLSNIVMIPADYMICKELREKRFVVTRYADDYTISNKLSFNHREVLDVMRSVFRRLNAPYTLKPEKTRYSSSAGSNWHVGLLLNKDNQISIGHVRRSIFRAMCHRYIMAKRNREPWDIQEAMHLSGLLSYYKHIEPHFTSALILKYKKKYNVDLKQMLRDELR